MFESVTLLTTKVEPFTLFVSPSLGLGPFICLLGILATIVDADEAADGEDDDDDDDESFDAVIASAAAAVAVAAAAVDEASSDDDENGLVVDCATGVEISFSFFPLKS